MSQPSGNPYQSPLSPPNNPPAAGLRAHPRGFWFIFWGEFAERCSYYGMMGILAVYMSDELGLGEGTSGLNMSLFIGGCYLLPLLGGYLADKYFGKYWTIVGFSVPYIFGHVVLGIETIPALVFALALLALGSGMTKPNISSLMGMTYDQQRPGQERLRSNAFAIFYMAINIGAAISTFLMPVIQEEYGYRIAFLFPAALMAIAFVIFAAGKKHYAVEVIDRTPVPPEERALQWKVLRRLFGLFLLVACFWAIFDQSHSTWIFFGNVYMDKDLFGLEMNAKQMQGWNPVFIIVMLPVVTWLWNVLAKKGIRIRATDKMLVGFVLTAVTMGIMSYAGYRAGPTETVVVVKDGKEVKERVPLSADRKVSLQWQGFAYIVLTIAEILISVTGLELAFVSAPNAMKGLITAVWLAFVGVGNLVINAPVTLLYPLMEPFQYFGMLAVAVLCVAAIFVFVAKRFNAALDADKAMEAAHGSK
jgi:solute carrier family 15 (oligopeptide transporter), member 1